MSSIKAPFRLSLLVRGVLLACLVGPTLASADWEPIPGFRPAPDPLRTPGHHTYLPSLTSDNDGFTYLSLADTLGILSPNGSIQKIASTREASHKRYCFRVAQSKGILYWGPQHSLDGGQTWSPMPSIPNIPSAMSACEDGSVLTGGIYENISLSVDTGRTWVRTNSETSFGTISAIHCLPKGWALAASTSGPLRTSPDGGKTWKAVKTETRVGSALLTVDPASQGELAWALDLTYRTAPNLYAIRRQNDSVSILPRPSKAFPESMVTAWAVSVPAASERRFWVGTWGQGILISDDSGSTWKTANAGLKDLHISAIALQADGKMMAITEDGLFSNIAAPVTSLSPADPKPRRKIRRIRATASEYGLASPIGAAQHLIQVNGQEISPRGMK